MDDKKEELIQSDASVTDNGGNDGGKLLDIKIKEELKMSLEEFEEIFFNIK